MPKFLKDDFITEYQTGNPWYRVHRSGWVEQGGTVKPNGTPSIITLPISMSDTSFSVTTCSQPTNPLASGLLLVSGYKITGNNQLQISSWYHGATNPGFTDGDVTVSWIATGLSSRKSGWL